MIRRSQPYPLELRERAVRMVIEVTPNYDPRSRHAGEGQPDVGGFIAMKMFFGNSGSPR
jgi:hypothetical protein